jgi:hypothetical protein
MYVQRCMWLRQHQCSNGKSDQTGELVYNITFLVAQANAHGQTPHIKEGTNELVTCQVLLAAAVH